MTIDCTLHRRGSEVAVVHMTALATLVCFSGYIAVTYSAIPTAPRHGDDPLLVEVAAEMARISNTKIRTRAIAKLTSQGK